eukprot:6466874-Pyramimonas_sp.AAC.1
MQFHTDSWLRAPSASCSRRASGRQPVIEGVQRGSRGGPEGVQRESRAGHMGVFLRGDLSIKFRRP